jgi:hypothetical protein
MTMMLGNLSIAIKRLKTRFNRLNLLSKFLRNMDIIWIKLLSFLETVMMSMIRELRKRNNRMARNNEIKNMKLKINGIRAQQSI